MTDKIYSNRSEEVEITCPECEHEFTEKIDVDLTIYEPDIDVDLSTL